MDNRYRTIFISDVHLGTPSCQANYLLDFLETATADRIILVGDIIDLIAMQKRVYLPASHQAVIDKLIALAASDTEVIYIPGNHDHLLRKFCGQTISNIKLMRRLEYRSKDNRKFMVSHGDEFDSILQTGEFLLLLGDISHNLLLKLNTIVSAIRRTLQLPYWSLSGYLKSRISKATQFINRYEHLAAYSSRKNDYDGFICGHIHFASLKRFQNVLYGNCGDWVEHCTSLVEEVDGTFSVLHWSEQKKVLITERELEGQDFDAVPANYFQYL